jgi:ABC-type nitrate/sulfonate/bicarbonate transport system substrate-binding protein
MSGERLRIGFIPLADAAALVIAADRGFAAKQDLSLDLVREVSWSNVRDKLNIGLFDAAHLLAPVAVASSLGIGHVKVPLAVPFVLAANGNAITVSPSLHAALVSAADGADVTDPKISAQALARVVAERRKGGTAPLTFGMTFPFSCHNYLLRFWITAAGLDPDEDVHLVVLPPPYMVDSLSSHQVDAFCVGAPWNSVAVELGVGHILHFGTDIFARVPEKVLAVRTAWSANRDDVLKRLVVALGDAADFINDPGNLEEVVALLASPKRIGAPPEIIERTFKGRLRIAPGGDFRSDPNYILIGRRENAARPEPLHAAWLYAQMLRWDQAPWSPDLLAAAKACFRPDLYDESLGAHAKSSAAQVDQITAFAGPPFVGSDIPAYVALLKAAFQNR